MKRKIILISTLLLMIIILIIILSSRNNNLKEKKITSNNMISLMYQDEQGNYQESDLNDFNQEGYRFNFKRSRCLNGSKINYQDGNIEVRTTKSDKCYAYFDNNSFVEDLSGNGNNGINYGAIWQKDGLLLGDETNFYGHVNCGLKNYNFKDSVTFVLKYSSNLFGGHLISNHEGGGLALMDNASGSIIYNVYLLELNDYTTARFNSVEKIGNTYILIGTYDGHATRIYIDGEEVANYAADDSIKPSPAPIVIGGNPDANGTRVGSPSHILVKEALIFDRALTAEEISQDYATNINPVNKDKLLVWYKFD